MTSCFFGFCKFAFGEKGMYMPYHQWLLDEATVMNTSTKQN